MHQHSNDETHLGILSETINHALMITFFVIIMMMIIELVNIQSKGRWNKTLQKRGFLQIILASFMGIMPGCLGTFAMVSLYVHRTISFAALLAVMIATSGDEIFLMFAMIPKTSFIIVAILFLVAVLSGLLVYLFTKKNYMGNAQTTHIEYHSDNYSCLSLNTAEISSIYKNISFHRSLLLFGFFVFTVLLITGGIGSHEWNWEKITFLIITIVGLFIAATASEHFLVEHLWNHIIKKHFLKIFLWTLGAFIFISILNHYIDAEEWIKSNKYIVLLIAVLIGIIPESGPHIVFISLFYTGGIPFSILLANSIVQDGHGAIPLLAESRKSFIIMKLINAGVGFIVGFLLLIFGF